MSDDFDIKSLPYDFKSASKPSETINRLLERKKYEHNKTMEWMRNKMAEINLVMDQKIKDSAQEVKKTLAKIKENVHEFIATVKAKTEIKDFPDNYLFTSLKALKNFHADQHIAVDEFCKFMHDTEKIRMQQFKDVLKEAKTKCVAIAHEVPFVLDEIFELESVALNEATIKNYKDYAEIEQDLKLQIIYDFKNWTSEIMIIKDLLREHFRIMVKKSLPISVTGEVISRDMSRTTSFATPCELHRLDSLKSQFVYAFFGEDNVPVARDEVERWLKGVQRTLGSLDQTARNIVSLYKSVIPILFHRFLDELDEIKHSMCIAGICHKKEIEDFKCEIYTPTVEQLNIEYTHQLEELQTYEASLNIEIEKLMEGSNEKDLSNALNNIYNILDKMELSYKTQSINEMEVVNKYKNMMNVGIEVLMAEVKRFLDVHPPDFEMDPKIQRRRASQITFYEIEEPILPIQILYCVFQVAAVKNWMFGLWEAIDQYFTTGRQEIEKRTEEWIEIQKQKIKERYDTKIAFHRPRYLHIKYSIYEKRLRGLQVHEKHLTCQKNVVEKSRKELRAHKTKYDEGCNRCCEEYEAECYKIANELGNMNSSVEIRGFVQTIKNRLLPMEKKINDLSEEYKDMCTSFLNDLKTSNYKFLKSIRLFSEGGNFSLQEVALTQSQLLKLEEGTRKHIEAIIATTEASREKYIARIQLSEANMIANVEEYIREHEFNERVEHKIQKVQQELKRLIRNLREKFKVTEKGLKEVYEEAKQNLGKIEYLESFGSKMETCLTEVFGIGEYITHPEPVQIFSVELETAIKGRQSKDYMGMLLNKHQDLAGEDFISKSVKLIHDSFLELEEFAKEFYHKHPIKYLDPSRLQPTLDDCMQEVLQKYKPCLLQCEISWIENVSSFLAILKNIETFRERFITSFENAFCRICLERLQLGIDDVYIRLNEQADQFNKKLKEIHNRLKVMFGHPRNYKMLENLEQDYKYLHEDNKTKFGTITPPHKEHLNEIYSLLIVELEQIDRLITDLATESRIEDLITNLTRQFETKTELISPIVFAEEDSHPVPLSRGTMENIQKYFTKSSSLQLETVFQRINLDSFSSLKTYETPESFLWVLEEKITSTYQGIDDFLDNKIIKANEDFKQTWAEDIKYILNLYKLKYDNKIF
ncbi:uncharacterized protein LOC126879219 isoform X2 [Diabrotica virgifera virgifera]|uniref:Uncharacterized protein n=1 Tax=Diabrotica virgifera virgifera TaxID=50390 RepID=A0ABM5JJW2_DIAVI|nr:uncharacterized protein LOC126879219 isoform X2 [Diabrotica virgifera virgifera]